MKTKNMPGYKKPWWVYVIEVIVVIAGVVIVAFAGKIQYQCITNGYDLGKLEPRTLRPICEKRVDGFIRYEHLSDVLYKVENPKVQ